MNGWTRKGWFYYAYLAWERGPYRGTVERKLDFISYHGIRFFHGDEGLKRIAMKPPRIE